MSNPSSDRSKHGEGDHTTERDQDDLHPEELHPEGLDPEPLAAGVDDVIAVFDREPPERPVTDADAQPGFG